MKWHKFHQGCPILTIDYRSSMLWRPSLPNRKYGFTWTTMCQKRNGAVALMMEMLGSVVGTCIVLLGISATDIFADTYFDPAKWVRGLGYMAEHVSNGELLTVAI
jgi:hypothetical protein